MAEYIDEDGQFVIDCRDRPRQTPTLRNIREGLLIGLFLNPPESQWSKEARWLRDYLTLAEGADAGERRRRLTAALDSMGYAPDIMTKLRYFVRERFGVYDPGALSDVHDWLVAKHDLSDTAAWEIKLPELLVLLGSEQQMEADRAGIQNSMVHEQTSAGLARSATPSGGGATPQEPRELLTGWQSITQALGMKYRQNKEVKSLNDRFGGPIRNSGAGTSPMVYKDDLINWWNQLAILQEDLANQREGGKLSAEAQHNYGREGTAAPEISGGVKKRRRDKKT